MAAVAYGSLPFAEQIQFLRAKRGVLTESYLDVFGAQHDVAFMVAGANRDDLLADFRAAIDKVIAEGATLAEFRKEFDRIVEQYGWDYTGGRNWRSRVIYETNLRQSYNAGRWDQLQKLKRARPYWRYRHSDAVEHPRPIHLGWHDLVLHADDPWWQTHFPANGWGCQCDVEALNERDLKRLGKSGPDTAPPIDMQTVTIGQRSPGGPRLVQTPNGIDPGFGYAPGRSLNARPPPGGPPGGPRTPPSLTGVIERAAQTAIDKTTRLPALPAAQTIEQVLALPRVTVAIDAGYAEWQGTVIAARQARNSTYFVGALDTEVVGALQAASVEPMTAAIVARDAEVIASIVAPRALGATQLARMPQLLREPIAVLLDRANQSLLYLVNASARRGAGNAVVAIGYQRTATNAFRTASLIDLAEIRADVAAGRLTLLRGAL